MVALRSLRLALTSLCVLGISACSSEIVIGSGACERDGKTFQVGEVAYPCGEECTCLVDGTFECIAVPTLVGCDTCVWEGQTYQVGDSFPAGDGCNQCSCDLGSDGGAVVGCTLKACPACTWNGQEYWPGETFPAGDGCNSCTCEGDGTVSCTLAICDGCTYAGVSYALGETFPAVDGCNSCSCSDGGGVSCTEEGCPCDPASEWWAWYAATDPMQCQLIDYACPDPTVSFQNSCGCGCAESLDVCAPMMACSDPALASCPYSQTDCG